MRLIVKSWNPEQLKTKIDADTQIQHLGLVQTMLSVNPTKTNGVKISPKQTKAPANSYLNSTK